MLRRRPPSTQAPTPATSARATPLVLLLSVLGGGASLFSFAPSGWWPLQLALLGWLFYQVGRGTSVRRALYIGWAFGTGWSIAGMHWLGYFMTHFAHLPLLLAALAVLLLGLYMGLFTALATAAATWLRRRWSLPLAAFVLLVLPACWGLAEWLRGWVFTGFPWASSGYAHIDAPLAGFAPIIGVFGVGMLVAACAGCLTLLTQRMRWSALGILVVLLGAGAALRSVEWTSETGQPITLRLLQGNTPQDQKFDQAFLDAILNRYQRLITAAPADLIATPETAFPVFPHQLAPGYLDALQQFAQRHGTTLALGMPLVDGTGQYTNSVVAFGPQTSNYRFDKAHLVPFGEFIPPGFRWFTEMMNIPLSDARRGAPLQAPFAVKDQWVLPNICYEDVFGEEIAYQLRHAAQPATMLLNVSNLSWYGQTVAIPQHLQISRMRALETGRPMLRATNDGATAVIDRRGQVVQQLPMYREGTLAATLRGAQGMTPYIRLGNGAMLAMALVLLCAAWWLGRRYRQR